MNRDEMAAVIELANREWARNSDRRPRAYAIADAVIAAQGDEEAELRARRNAPETSRHATDKIRQGTISDMALGMFRYAARHPEVLGFTDDELEIGLGRSHQSVSAARNTLMRRGYVVATDERRQTRWGNPAVVYVWTGKEPVR